MSPDQRDLPPDLQRLLALDDADAATGPAAPLPRNGEQALITNVLYAWRPARTPAPTRRRVPAWMVAAAVLGAGSAAAYFVARRANGETVTSASTGVGTGTGTGTGAGAGAGTDTDTDTDTDAEVVARDLLAKANRLRGEGRYRQAAATYLRAAEHAPADQIAQVAQVAAADLALERLDDAEQALSLYRAALSAPGPLSLEARAGTARAQRALGDTAGERRTLETLLQSHGEADWARTRLDELRRQGQ